MRSLAVANVGLLRVAVRRLRVIAGFFLLALGAAGLLLPFVPGTVLILAGVTLAGANHPWLAPVIDKVRGWLHRRMLIIGHSKVDSSDGSL
jgi:hypothetical protein